MRSSSSSGTGPAAPVFRFALGRMAGDRPEQIQPLEPPARHSQPAQRHGPPRFLAGGLGEGRDHRLPRPLPLGGISAVGLHDARRRRRGRQPLQRLPRAQGGRQAPSARGKPSKKGKGFEQPLRPHEHWHIDVSYINICGTFFFLCSILDGYSRFVVHWEIRETMKEFEVETVIQRAREQFPGERPRIISDNGPQFIAQDFKEFIRICGMTHVRTSPYYPQSNGKMERWFKTLKGGCIRVKTPLSLEDARRLVAEFVAYYNTVRLHSAIGYVTPADKLAGRAEAIWGRGERSWRRPTPGGEPRPRRRKLPSPSPAMYTEKTWAEDRATRGRDPSADPGPRPGGRQDAAPCRLRDWPKSDKSIHSFCSATTLKSRAVCPIHAEPTHPHRAVPARLRLPR